MEWYNRLADISELDYQPLIPVDRQALWGSGLKPTIHRFSFDDKPRQTLSWPMPGGGSTSASPANQHGFIRTESSPNAVLTSMTEALELPGTASNYHFIVQNAHEALSKFRRADPTLYAIIEQLCLLDIKLVEARSDEVFDGSTFRVVAFGRLERMYALEGRLHDALDIKERGLKVQQGSVDKELELLRSTFRGLSR